MKFLSNILIIASLIVYVFCPILDCGIIGRFTGYTITEIMINQMSISYALLSLIPFIAGFCAIYFNCLKNKYWSILSICAILIEISFFSWAYDNILNLLETVKVNVNVFAWGFSTTFWLIVSAAIFALLALTPMEKLFVKERDKVKNSLNK